MIDIANPATLPMSGIDRSNVLPSGCMLNEYRIEQVLGIGGFGITYKAWDTLLETWVAIKEYFPVAWSFRDSDGLGVHFNTQGGISSDEDGLVSYYLWGLERFLDEARILARIQHPCVVRVKRYFRAHGTAYIVMDYEDGKPLSAVLQDGETLDEAEVQGLLEDVLPALQAVHEQGYLHRDIKPSNLYVRASDQRVMLIDFGAARQAVGCYSKSVTSLVTPGYSPPEQYTTRNDRHGAWTDIYALGAVLYRCVTGNPPLEAAERMLEDTLEPVAAAGAGRYNVNLLRVIDRALAVRPEQRFATIAEIQTALNWRAEEDDDETVVVAPLPGGTPNQAMRASNAIAVLATGEERASATDCNSLNLLPPIDTHLNLATARLEVMRPSLKSVGAPPQKLSWIPLAGVGMLLAALMAVVLVWLWPTTPVPAEQPPAAHAVGEPPSATPKSALTTLKPPPVLGTLPSPVSVSDSTESRAVTASSISEATPTIPNSDANTAEPVVEASATTSTAASRLETLATPEASSKTPSGEAKAPELPLVTQPSSPSQAIERENRGLEPITKSNELTVPPPSIVAPAFEPGPRRAGEMGGQLKPRAEPTSKAQSRLGAASDTRKAITTKAESKPAELSASRSRPARRQPSKKRMTPQQSNIVVTPTPRLEEKPTARTTVGNPWEAPTSTGFNQK